MILVQDLVSNDVYRRSYHFSATISAVGCEQHPKSTRLTATYYGIAKTMYVGIL